MPSAMMCAGFIDTGWEIRGDQVDDADATTVARTVSNTQSLNLWPVHPARPKEVHCVLAHNLLICEAGIKA
jgi:hypothetical protein